MKTRSSATTNKSSRRGTAHSDSPRFSSYPFSAIVGQEEMKLALILNVIDPHIGGVLVMGHRGTGKSTAVRGLAGLLPSIDKVKGCIYGCDPSLVNSLCTDCRKRIRPGRALPRVNGQVP